MGGLDVNFKAIHIPGGHVERKSKYEEVSLRCVSECVEKSRFRDFRDFRVRIGVHQGCLFHFFHMLLQSTGVLAKSLTDQQSHQVAMEIGEMAASPTLAISQIDGFCPQQ